MMTDKFCVYCQEVTPHYVNEYGALECCNCGPDRVNLIALKRIQLIFQTVINFTRHFYVTYCI